jgi:hypothetical protein
MIITEELQLTFYHLDSFIICAKQSIIQLNYNDECLDLHSYSYFTRLDADSIHR